MTTIILSIIILLLGIAYINRTESSSSSYRDGFQDGKTALNENVEQKFAYIERALERQHDILADTESCLQEAYFCGVEYAVLYSYINKRQCCSPDDVSTLIENIMDDTNNGEYDKDLHRLKVIRMFDDIESDTNSSQ